MAKKYKIILIPEGSKNVRHLSIPPWLVPLVCVLLVGSAVLAGYWYKKYSDLAQSFPNLASAEQQNRIQDKQLQQLAQRLNAFKDEMAKVQEFTGKLRAMANLEEPKNRKPLFGIGGHEGVSDGGIGVRLATSARDRQMMNMQRDLDQLHSASLSEISIQRELAKFLNERRSILASTPSIWPTHGWVTSGFGYRVSPFTGQRTFHAGLDISTRFGSTVKSPADGVVTFAGREGAYGLMVVINHGHGMVTRYGHLSASKVNLGDKVKRGQLIAQVGSSGRSSGPHLHYEVILSGVPTNPRNYILD